MENKDLCLIEQTKRLRVHGDGPKRKELKPFVKIAQIPEELLSLLDIIPNVIEGNDLGTDTYKISQQCDVESVFSVKEKYRQILLQTQLVTDSEIDELTYTHWNNIVDNRIKEYLNTIFLNVYRFRMSVMDGNHEINWHIDTDPSILCRAQICLKAEGTTFDFKTKDGIHSLVMERGGIYFINTGWSHRVVNTNSEKRIVALFGFEFKDIDKNYQTLLKI